MYSRNLCCKFFCLSPTELTFHRLRMGSLFYKRYHSKPYYKKLVLCFFVLQEAFCIWACCSSCNKCLDFFYIAQPLSRYAINHSANLPPRAGLLFVANRYTLACPPKPRRRRGQTGNKCGAIPLGESSKSKIFYHFFRALASPLHPKSRRTAGFRVEGAG